MSRRSRRCSSGVAGALPHVLDAYRSGDGVPYERYGADFRDGQGADQPAGVRARDGRLAGRRRPRSTSACPATARASPTSAAARATRRSRSRAPTRTRASTGSTSTSRRSPTPVPTRREPRSAGRVSFITLDGGALSGEERYDLVCIFEALHDMARPVEALVAARESLAPGGSVLVVDERVAERFAAPGDRGRAGHVRLERRPLPRRSRSPSSRRPRSGRCCARTRCAASPPTPASRRSRCCRSRTTSSASTGSCPSRRPATSRTRAPRCGC